ncbi:hypothetical protein BGZ76_002218 [Entomortierella beljakovae]|nr:hypothetical protein BGZ76_002218 [Entomortierella beljakovae]
MSFPTSTSNNRTFRLWVLFFAFVLEALMIATFLQVALYKEVHIPVYWRDWLNIVADTLIFLTYAYSIRGKPLTSKALRAILVNSLAALIFFTNFELIFSQVEYAATEYFGAFECGGDTICTVFWAYIYFNIFVGFLSMVEAFLTLRSDIAGMTEVGPDQPYEQQVMQSIPA